MTPRYSSLVERLKSAGVTVATEADTQAPESPWYIKALLALSGWIAALFILGFLGVGLGEVVKNSVASGVIGLVMVVCAFAFLHKTKNDFAEHLMLATSLAGQLLFAWALISALNNVGAAFWWYLALLHVVLAALMPSFVHRVFSAFAAVFSIAMAMSESGAAYLTNGFVLATVVVIWLHELRYPNKLMFMHSIGYGLVLGLLSIQVLVRFEHVMTQGDIQTWSRPWMGEAIAGAALLYLIWHLLQGVKQTVKPLTPACAYAGALLLFIGSIQAYGLTHGFVVLLLGFAISNRLLLGLGVVCLLFSISSYYYLLDITLLAKAQTLLMLGLLFLGCRELLHRLVPAQLQERPDA